MDNLLAFEQMLYNLAIASVPEDLLVSYIMDQLLFVYANEEPLDLTVKTSLPPEAVEACSENLDPESDQDMAEGVEMYQQLQKQARTPQPIKQSKYTYNFY